MERVMLSLGTLSARASRIAFWSLRFMSALPPPSLAAIWMARQSFDHSLPRRASAAPFLSLMVAQWECPDMRPIITAGGEGVNHAKDGTLRLGESPRAIACAEKERGAIVAVMNISPDVRANVKE